MSSPEKITFEELPQAISALNEKVQKLTELVINKFDIEQDSISQDSWMDLDELCNYLPDKPSKPTVYAWVCQRSIPYHKPSKKLSFLKSEIDDWLIKSRRLTLEEINEQAINHCNKRRIK